MQTSAATFFRRVTCELLVDGQLVEVEGPVISGVLRADKVQLEDARGIDRRADVAGLSGSCPSLTFSVGGQMFITNSTTEFKDLVLYRDPERVGRARRRPHAEQWSGACGARAASVGGL